MRWVRRKTELHLPRGSERCQPWELERWAEAGWPCAPYHFAEINQVQNNGPLKRGGHVPGLHGPRLRLPSVEELERLMGFETGYAVPVMGSSAAKEEPELFAYSRKALLGNSMSCWVCSYILGCLASDLGYLVRPPTRAELRSGGQHQLRAQTAATAGETSGGKHVRGYTPEQSLAVWLMSQAGSRGSDVRLTTGQLTASTKVRFQHISVGWWGWRELFGFDFLRVRI